MNIKRFLSWTDKAIKYHGRIIHRCDKQELSLLESSLVAKGYYVTPTLEASGRYHLLIEVNQHA